MKVFPFFRHCLKDLDKIMMMPKWDVIEVEQAWRYVTGIKVHLRKNMTIQVTVSAAYLRHHQFHQPILENYRDLISLDIASSPQMACVAQDDTSDDEPEPTQEPTEEPSEEPCQEM